MNATHTHQMPDEKAATRAVAVSAIALGIASAVEFATSVGGHSAGVLADALHNAGDVLTTLVLLAAFALARRPATRRFTQGFGRVEDVATLVISPSTKAGTKSATLFNHYSLLGTAEQLLGLPKLGKASSATTMSAAFNL